MTTDPRTFIDSDTGEGAVTQNILETETLPTEIRDEHTPEGDAEDDTEDEDEDEDEGSED